MHPIRRFRRSTRDRIELYERLKDGPCIDCGARFDPVCMDFDHRPGTDKIENLARLLQRGTVEDILEEVEKCDLVCACCHRLRTKARSNLSFKRRPESYQKPWDYSKQLEIELASDEPEILRLLTSPLHDTLA